MSTNDRILLALSLTPLEDQHLKRAARHTSKGKMDILSEWLESGINHAHDVGAEAASLTDLQPVETDDSRTVKLKVWVSIISDSRASQLASHMGISKDALLRHFFEQGLEKATSKAA